MRQNVTHYFKIEKLSSQEIFKSLTIQIYKKIAIYYCQYIYKSNN